MRHTAEDGDHRDLFFDAETGLLRGEDGPSTPLVVYDEYQTFGAITIPTRMTIYESESGIMEVLVIEDVTFPSSGDAAFAIPRAVRDMPRTADQIEVADADARRRWGDRLGEYERQSGSESLIYAIEIRGGRLALRTPGGAVYLLLEPDDAGRWNFAGVPGVAISFAIGDSGRPVSLTIHQEGADDATLSRVDAR